MYVGLPVHLYEKYKKPCLLIRLAMNTIVCKEYKGTKK